MDCEKSCKKEISKCSKRTEQSSRILWPLKHKISQFIPEYSQDMYIYFFFISKTRLSVYNSSSLFIVKLYFSIDPYDSAQNSG